MVLDHKLCYHPDLRKVGPRPPVPIYLVTLLGLGTALSGRRLAFAGAGDGLGGRCRLRRLGGRRLGSRGLGR